MNKLWLNIKMWHCDLIKMSTVGSVIKNSDLSKSDYTQANIIRSRFTTVMLTMLILFLGMRWLGYSWHDTAVTKLHIEFWLFIKQKCINISMLLYKYHLTDVRWTCTPIWEISCADNAFQTSQFWFSSWFSMTWAVNTDHKASWKKHTETNWNSRMFVTKIRKTTEKHTCQVLRTFLA